MKVLITGGAGFIGTNLAEYFLEKKYQVTILDNFSRIGTKINAEYLTKRFPNIQLITADIRNLTAIKSYVQKHEIIFHLAGQVAVTTSIVNPREDFESNILGTFNILEAARLGKHKPIIIDSSTNKVYGNIQGKIIKKGNRYIDLLHKKGISENEPLDFYSPYGCSKGAADQYVHDYYRIYGIPTVVFRQSCIYGPHQFGVEDQGWVAHFIIRAFLNKRITIYSTGYQVRDILYIDDLIDAYQKSINSIKKIKGEVFNIGGGEENSLSLLEFVKILEKKLNKKIPFEVKQKRPGDQDIFISNNSKVKKLLQWKPDTKVSKGLDQLIDWVRQNSNQMRKFS